MHLWKKKPRPHAKRHTIKLLLITEGTVYNWFRGWVMVIKPRETKINFSPLFYGLFFLCYTAWRPHRLTVLPGRIRAHRLASIRPFPKSQLTEKKRKRKKSPPSSESKERVFEGFSRPAASMAAAAGLEEALRPFHDRASDAEVRALVSLSSWPSSIRASFRCGQSCY